MKITIDVKREDGKVTRLSGRSGMAVTCGDIGEKITRETDTPVVSLRCSSAAELAWNLAALLGAVQSVSPEAYEMAHALVPAMNFREPVAQRRL